MTTNASLYYQSSFLLLCLVLIETSRVMLAPHPLQAEAGHVGYGPPSPVHFFARVGRTETDQVAALPGWSAFDIRNFWMRADLRVRPEWRNGVCFGGGPPINGACNSLNAAGSSTSAHDGGKASDFYIQQWARLGLGYDPSPGLNFYVELQDSATWGANGNPTGNTQDSDALNHQCGARGSGQCRLGIRAGYALIRNLAGIDGLSIKMAANISCSEINVCLAISTGRTPGTRMMES